MSSTVGKTIQDEYRLEAKLPEWCVLKPSHAVLCAAFAVLFLYYSYLRVPITGVWSHVRAGARIADAGLFAAEKGMPLNEGIRSIHLGWLGDWLIHGCYSLWDTLGLQLLFSVSQSAALGLLVLLFSRLSDQRSGRALAMTVPALCVFSFLGATHIAISNLCLATFLLTLTWNSNSLHQTGRPRIAWSTASPLQWSAVAILMIVWTNLHASFFLAPLISLCLCLGRAVDELRTTKLRNALRDRELQSRILLLELLCACTFFTPFGLALPRALLWWPDNPLVESFGGFVSAPMFSWIGLVLLLSWLIWAIAFRSTKTLVFEFIFLPLAATLLVGLNASLVFFAVQLILFSTAGLLEPKSTKKMRKTNTHEMAAPQRPLRFAFTLICGLCVWVGFSLSPFGEAILGGTPRLEHQRLAKDTPLSTKRFLREQKNPGLTWTPNYWSEYLGESTNVELFVGENLLESTPQVQRDYRSLFTGTRNWKRIAERYSLQTFVVDKVLQKEFLRQHRLAPGNWRTTFEDDTAIVLQLTEDRS